MREKILLVDDEVGLRKVLGLSLEDRGFQVETASSGHEALDIVSRWRPDIVLTDIKMPGMDGLDLLKSLKNDDPDVEIIMITGHGDIDLAIESLKFDATDFITKPIDDTILDIALKRAQERISMRCQIKAYTENLERLVEEKSRQLVQRERLAAMGETVAGLAHAIKNISGGLKGGVFVVEKGLDLDNAKYLRQGWRMVRDNVDRIQQLSLDLLNIANPGTPRFRSANPTQPLQSVFDLMQPTAREFGVELVMRAEDNLGRVEIDAEGLHRCLLNLVSNAMDACLQEGGNSPARIIISCCQEEDGICYRVADNGGGMDPGVEDKIFNAFFSTKGSRGTGIGLMLTRKIVEVHGGTIDVVSTKGEGSTFTIRLPSK